MIPDAKKDGVTYQYRNIEQPNVELIKLDKQVDSIFRFLHPDEIHKYSQLTIDQQNRYKETDKQKGMEFLYEPNSVEHPDKLFSWDRQLNEHTKDKARNNIIHITNDMFNDALHPEVYLEPTERDLNVYNFLKSKTEKTKDDIELIREFESKNNKWNKHAGRSILDTVISDGNYLKTYIGDKLKEPFNNVLHYITLFCLCYLAIELVKN
jgi:hypothetical protein